MGLFFNYSKPGPGVEKDAPKKKGVFLYFEIFLRKIWKLCQVNMLFFICSIPMIAIYYLLSAPVFMGYVNGLAEADSSLTKENISLFQTIFCSFFPIITITLLGSGPASAAYAYIQRCFAREEHAWIMSDFFGKMKENFKQGMIVAILDIVLLVVGGIAISIYHNLYIQKGQIIWFFLMCVLIIFMIFYVFIHYYIYQLMITFENKTRDLFKNAFLLAFSTMPVNIIFTLASVIIGFLIFSTLTPIISLMLSFLILISALRFPYEFYASSVIKKKIIDNMKDNENDEDTMTDRSDN